MARSRAACGFITTAAVSGLLVALPAAPSQAAATDCPTALPTAQAVDGLTGTGYTVEKGTEAEEFTATVLGRVTDGIAPGVDMIMAEVDSDALDRAGGVWAGMSGSPVYTADGRLIGSVSYGLTASSKIAGITPAEDLLDLGTGTTGAEKISISAARAARVAKTGEASKTLAAKGFERLPVPVSASGLATRNTKKFLSDITADSGMSVRSGGAKVSTTAKSSADEIFAGSNYAAALSYGDVSLTGLGTTTYVCDGTAVAFGHPFLSAGKAEYSVHPATAVYVQEDPTAYAGGPFKVGNPGGVVGTVTFDGTIGLRSTLGQTPQHTFPITTSLKTDAGKTVTGKTVGVYQPYAADIAANHVLSAVIKALGAQSGGSAAVKFTVTGTRDGGKKFTVTHSDHYASSSDVSYTTALALYDVMGQLVDQTWEDVNITGVKVTGSVTDEVKQYTVKSVQAKKSGKWVALKGTQKVKPGSKMVLRATLSAYRDSTKKVTVPLTVTVPKKSKGATGSLSVYGGITTDASANSLTGLLKQLNNASRADTLTSEVTVKTAKGAARTSTRRTALDGTVNPYGKVLSVVVK